MTIQGFCFAASSRLGSTRPTLTRSFAALTGVVRARPLGSSPWAITLLSFMNGHARPIPPGGPAPAAESVGGLFAACHIGPPGGLSSSHLSGIVACSRCARAPASPFRLDDRVRRSKRPREQPSDWRRALGRRQAIRAPGSSMFSPVRVYSTKTTATPAPRLVANMNLLAASSRTARRTPGHIMAS
jgi:hypothetical protein